MVINDLRLLDLVPVATYVCDRRGQIQSFNQAAIEVWGQVPNAKATDEAFHHAFNLLNFNGQSVCYADTPIAEVLRTGKAVKNRALLIQRADGSEVAVLINAVPIVDNQTLVGAIASLQDITEQHRTERLLQSVLDNTPGVIYIKDQEGRLLMVNRHFAQLAGRSVEEIVGKRDREIFSDPNLEEILENDRRILAENKLVQLEESLDLPDGRHTFLSIKLPAEDVGFPGKVLCGFTTDITDRKRAESALHQSEERLRIAQQAAKAGVWNWDIVTNQVTWSAEYYQLYGLDPATTQPSYDNWLDSIVEQDRDRADRIARESLEHQSDLNVEFRVHHPIHGARWITAIGQTFYDADHQPIRMTGIALDITERKQAEAEREHLLRREQAARAEAQAANRIKDEFLAVLSHELRTPLNPILGWSKLLQSGKLNQARTLEALTTIERNAKLQAELIEDLFDVSRILQGKLSLNMVPVDLAATIRAAMETVRLAAEAKSIQIQTELDTSVRKILGGSARLQQVVWNLLSNAVKFTPTEGRVNIRLENLGDQAQMIIRDTGKGIAPDFLPYVFDYFRQEDGATTRKFGGLGLGLAIVRHLVELHGGTIRAESEGEGRGATFIVRLPLMPTQAETDTESLEPDLTLGLDGIRVLVVEDETDTRELIAFLLEQAGAQVLAVASGFEGLAVFTQSKPDLLLSDIGMPDMDGYMLLQQIRALPAEQGGKIPAIALTAYAGEMNQQQAIAAGFQHHLAKPVEPEELVRVIASVNAANAHRMKSSRAKEKNDGH
ncbi:PAS domain S-box protein [Leptolyngbya sp. AN10]